MRPPLAAFALACATGMLVAASAAAEATLPAAVAAELQPNVDLCREVGGTPHTADAVKSADLTGDGKPDHVLYLGWLRCDGAASLYGDREKGLSVYAGDGAGGATAAFSAMAFDAKIEGAGAAAKLWLTVSGGQCGKPPAPDFARESFCDRAVVWNAKARKFDFAPVSTVRMIE
jgi:hypothetical protein